MEQTELAKSLSIAYQPHPITPIDGRQGLVAVTDGTATVRNILLSTCVDPHQPIVIQLDGKLLTVEEWDTVCPTQGQLLSVQGTVQGGGGDSNALQIALMIAVVITATALAGGGGAFLGAEIIGTVTVGQVLGAVVMVAGSYLVGSIFKPEQSNVNSSGESVSPTYSLSGGQNRARPYEPMPVVLGTYRMFLDYAARPYTEYRGNDQYLYQIFSLGLGNLSASEYKIGTTDITSYTDFEFVTPDVNGRLANFPSNVDTAAGAPLTNVAGYIQRTTSSGTYQIGLDFESVLFFATDKGTFNATSVQIEIQYKLQSSGTWITPASLDIYGDNFTYDGTYLTTTGASQKPNRGTVYISGLTLGTYDVQVRRITVDSPDTRSVSNTNWSTIRSYQQDASDYVGQNRIGLIIRATEQLNGAVQQLSALVESQSTYWNGSAWVTGVTDNPAHIFMHFAKGVYNADGKLMYGVGLTDSQLDLAGLSVWASFCNAEGLSFNGVLDSSKTSADMLNAISMVGFGSPTWASGKLGVVYDARSASPVMTFGMSNILRDSFQVSYISENLAEEIVVRYADPAKDYAQEEVRTLAPDVITPLRTSAIDLFGCTNVNMAGKFANYLAAQQYYRRRRVSWQSDFEGFVCQRGDVVLVSHDMTQWGYSGRFVAANNNILTLDRSVPRQNQIEYLMLIRPDGTTTTYDVSATTSAESDTLTIINDTVQLQSGASLIDHRWCFSPLETQGKKLKILSVQPASDSRLQIVATDEYDEFYDAWNGTFILPEISTVLPKIAIEVTNVTAINRIAFVNGYLTNRVSLSWNISGSVLYSAVKIYFNGNLLLSNSEVKVPYVELDIDGEGLFYAEITPFNATGAGVTQNASLTLSALALPAPPESVTLVVGEDGTSATYTWTPVLGAQSYVIQIFADGSVKRSVNVGNSLSYTYTLEDSLADGGPFRTYTFGVYSVDIIGQSTSFASVEFSNPQIGQLQNAFVKPLTNSIRFKCDRPTESDFKAIKIWVSKNSGFTPTGANIVFDGDSNSVTISADADGNPLESNIAYYIKAAGYDTYGDDNLTLTDELTATVLSPAWAILQDDIETSMLESGLRDRIDLIDAPSSTANSVSARIQSEATIRAQEILDEALTRANEDSALQTQIDVISAASSGDFQDLIAAVQEEQTARIAGDAAEATSRETLATQVRGSYTGTDASLVTTGLIYSERTSRSTADSAIASSVTALSSTVTNNYNTLNSSIVNEASTRATSDSALTTQINIVSAQATKTRTYSQDNAPTSGMIAGDLWFDTNDNNKAYRYSGSVWVLTDDTRIAFNTAAITTETNARTTADESLASQITTVSATANAKNKSYRQTTAPTVNLIEGDIWFDSDDSNKPYRYSGTAWVLTNDTRIAANTAAITTEATTRASADASLASQINTVQTTVNGNTTSIETNATSIDGIEGKYTVKIDNNGYVSGYGLISTNNNATPFAEFAIIADRFSIAPVATNPDDVNGSPFFVLTAPTVIGGRTFSAGTYLKEAFVGNLNADNIVSGFIDAELIEADSIDATKIDSRNLSIKDNAGTVIFSSGTPLSWDNADIGLGINLLRNGGFEDGLAGWAGSFYTTPTAPIIGWNLSSSYNLKGTGLAYITPTGAVANTQIFDAINPDYIPIESSTRYEAHALVNTHRCSAYVVIVWYDSNLTYITENGGNSVTLTSEVNVLSDLRQTLVFAISPSNAKFARVIVRGLVTTSTNDPYVFIKNAYFGQAGISQSTPSVWTAGRGINFINAGNASTYIESAAIGTAFIGDAAITTAKIGTAQIDTLRVAGNAITVQGSVQRGSGGTSSFTITSPAGGQVLILGYFAGSDFANRSLSVYVNGGFIGTVTGTSEVSGFAGDTLAYRTGQGSKMFLISVGAGTTTISGTTATSDGGFVLSGLLTMR